MLHTFKVGGTPFFSLPGPLLLCDPEGDIFRPERADLDEVRLISPHP